MHPALGSCDRYYFHRWFGEEIYDRGAVVLEVPIMYSGFRCDMETTGAHPIYGYVMYCFL